MNRIDYLYYNNSGPDNALSESIRDLIKASDNTAPTSITTEEVENCINDWWETHHYYDHVVDQLWLAHPECTRDEIEQTLEGMELVYRFTVIDRKEMEEDES